jgi:hypothetical protein
VPLYPPQMTSSPINLHVHGVHASPKGNADNVLLHIPAGKSNTYTYNIPKSMPQGAIGITAISTRSPRRTSITAWSDCSRSGAPTETCRW